MLTFLPFQIFFHPSTYKGAAWGAVAAGLLMACILFLPLPISFVLSRERFKRGEKFIYA
jgi:hypothetical protein